MHACRGFLGDAANVLGDLAVPAGLRLEARLDGGEQRLFFFVRGLVEEGGVAAFRAHAEVDEQGGVAAVVEDHVRGAAVGPFEDAVGVVPIVRQALALDREHRRAARRDGRRRVILRRVDVARGPAHVRAQRLQRLDQRGGLDGHVQRAGDARALQRLGGAEFGARGHQAGHLGLGDVELLAAPIGQRDVFDDVIVGSGHGERSLVWRRARYSRRSRRGQEAYKEMCMSLSAARYR